MGFRINTNISAMNAYVNSSSTSRALDESISKLSSGLRINKAADDASGMTIADSLKAQASALGQAIANGNDAIGIVQTADKAMDEQLSILNTIRTKAVQAAQDGQTSQSREALQSDISRLLEELDNIATTTSFNGQQLLNGNFSNKNFQIGAYANQTVQVSIGATASDKIGLTRFETSGFMAFSTAAIASASLTLSGIDGYGEYKFQDISKEEMQKDGLKAIADRINGVSDLTGVSAKVLNTITFTGVVQEGTINGLQINGITIGKVEVKAGDSNAVLINAINKVKEQTGVEASRKDGKLTLTARDGRAIKLEFSAASSQIGALSACFSETSGMTILGKLTLIRQDARDIVVKITGGGQASKFSICKNDGSDGAMSGAVVSKTNQQTVSLGNMNSGILSSSLAAAMGYFGGGITANDQLSGVTTYYGAQAMISISESAQKALDRIRSDLGSVQNQLQSTINNISVTQVNVKSAESQIRDVDFATEASNFNKYNILAQSGSYAMSQANTIQQNVMRLLQ